MHKQRQSTTLTTMRRESQAAGRVIMKKMAVFEDLFLQQTQAHMSRSVLILLLVMVTLSTADMLLDWANYFDLRTDTYRYGAVIGAPSNPQLMGMLFFCIMGTSTWVLETGNVLVTFVRKGSPFLPYEYEQVVVCLFEEVPLAIINLHITLCRYQHQTPLQVCTGVFAMVSIFLRLYVYTSVKDKTFLLRRNEHTCTLILKSSTFIVGLMTLALIFVTWSRTTAHIFGVARQTNPDINWMDGVTLYYLHAPKIKESKIKFDKMDLTNYVRHQGLPMDRPWLVEDLSVITRVKNSTGYPVSYPCTRRAADRPDLCGSERQRGGRLLFLLYYDVSQPNYVSPLGQVRFGVAYVDPQENCHEITNMTSTKWQLFFFRQDLQLPPSRHSKVLVQSPWPNICTVPFPVHDPQRLKPCTDYRVHSIH